MKVHVSKNISCFDFKMHIKIVTVSNIRFLSLSDWPWRPQMYSKQHSLWPLILIAQYNKMVKIINEGITNFYFMTQMSISNWSGNVYLLPCQHSATLFRLLVEKKIHEFFYTVLDLRAIPLKGFHAWKRELRQQLMSRKIMGLGLRELTAFLKVMLSNYPLKINVYIHRPWMFPPWSEKFLFQ